MTQTQEFTGKDLDIAIKNACAALSLSKGDLKYDVISEGTSGIFGIVGRKDAKIRVFLPEPDQTEDMEGVLSIVDEAFGRDRRQSARPVPRPEVEDRGKTGADPMADGDMEEYDSDEDALEEGDPEDDATEAYDLGEYGSEDDTYDAGMEEDGYETDVEPVDVSEESARLGVETLQKMADLITEGATVTAHTEADRLTLSIEGGNAGILIGRKGQTLDAMQFLTDKIINRKSEARVRVRVDIEGYMETRKANLKHLAFKMADKAKKTGRPATINQMSAQDRRIVHLALKDDTKVRTQSMGEGYYRRLVIFPKKKTAFRGKRRLKR